MVRGGTSHLNTEANTQRKEINGEGETELFPPTSLHSLSLRRKEEENASRNKKAENNLFIEFYVIMFLTSYQTI